MRILKKSLMQWGVIALLFASGNTQEPGSSTIDFDGEGTFDMQPGMGLRLTQVTIN
jgi:hypothetical protein